MAGLLCAVWAVAAVLPAAAESQPVNAQTVLDTRCGGCHSRLNSGALSRIGEIRKTPEGWDIDIQRMAIWHGVVVPENERAGLVQLLANRQGLAPSEAAPYRYALERRPNFVEAEDDPNLVAMCARCHTLARVGLQRRDAEEWRRLVHTHVGQWPTLEYQDKSRNRYWWKDATQELPDKLGQRFGLDSAAWSAWRRRPRSSPAGDWSLSGFRPGRGAYAGSLSVVGNGRDRFETQVEIEYEDGTRITGSGSAMVYTGYEWRGSARWGDESVREVYALSEDGSELVGRWFLEDQDAIGGDFRARRRQPDSPEIVAVLPGSLRAGERRNVTIHGAGLPLEGAVSLGPGVLVTEVLSRDENRVAVVAEAAADLKPGIRAVSVGSVRRDEGLVGYRTVEALRVEPQLAIARLGGGPIDPVPAQFDAFGFLRGPDGKPATADDIALGRMTARWHVEPFDEVAAEMDDVTFAGKIDADGRFHPAGAGPNPARRFSTNNAGRLKVAAEVGEGDAALRSESELVVTVQRWIDPAIR